MIAKATVATSRSLPWCAATTSFPMSTPAAETQSLFRSRCCLKRLAGPVQQAWKCHCAYVRCPVSRVAATITRFLRMAEKMLCFSADTFVFEKVKGHSRSSAAAFRRKPFLRVAARSPALVSRRSQHPVAKSRLVCVYRRRAKLSCGKVSATGRNWQSWDEDRWSGAAGRSSRKCTRRYCTGRDFVLASDCFLLSSFRTSSLYCTADRPPFWKGGRTRYCDGPANRFGSFFACYFV